MEDHYSSDEGEVFLGSVAESEVLKRRRFLGSNYNSPVTPRPPRHTTFSSGIQRILPDVLSTTTNTSTPVHSSSQPLSTASKDYQQLQNQSAHSESSNDVIILDASVYSNSVITLSDDDSFMRNEETCSNKSTRVDNMEENSMESRSATVSNISNNSDAQQLEGLKLCFESSSNRIDLVSESMTSRNKTLPESGSYNSKNGINLSDTSAFNGETSSVIEQGHEIPSSGDSNSAFHEDRNIQKSGIENLNIEDSRNDSSYFDHVETKFVHETPAKLCELNSSLENITSLVQDIDEFIGNSSIFEKNTDESGEVNVDYYPVPSNDTQKLNLSSNHSVLGQEGSETNVRSICHQSLSSSEPLELEKTNSNAVEENYTSTQTRSKHSPDVSNLSNLEFSLNGVTDSILNISHGSSLPSLPNTPQSVNKKQNLYEDISCDGEQLGDTTDYSYSDKKTSQEDLHMSVDEVDFQQEGFSDDLVYSGSLGNCTNTSQPSLYISYASAQSSYTTACDRTSNEYHSTLEQKSFQNYRDVSNDLDICNETDIDTFSIKSNEENGNEANFEMVIQNRQNSFNGTPVSKMMQNNKEPKSKVMSKLPVFQNTKSLLQPPKFHLKPDALKTSSFKFAKQISNTGNEKHSSRNNLKTEACKIPGPSMVKQVNPPLIKEKKNHLEKGKTFTRTPRDSPKQKMASPKQFLSLPKSKIPSSVHRTPARNIVNVTPAKSAATKTPLQNFSSIPRAVKSDSKVNCALTPSGDLKGGLSAGKSIPTKNKYKNIISPIQAYIRSSPTVSQRKARIASVDEESPDGQKQKVSPVKAVSKVMQKLKFENVQGQENVNPNVIDPSRDTLPCKILEPALEVFLKEGQQPQTRLPKMGEKQTKILLATPKVKITIHEGRVNQSPKSKGVLVPNHENSASSSSDIVNVNRTPSEQPGGRISVRVEKTIELP